jgi:hypothetical protein
MNEWNELNVRRRYGIVESGKCMYVGGRSQGVVGMTHEMRLAQAYYVKVKVEARITPLGARNFAWNQ